MSEAEKIAQSVPLAALLDGLLLTFLTALIAFEERWFAATVVGLFALWKFGAALIRHREVRKVLERQS